MKVVEQLLVGARARVRAGRASLGLAGRPASLVLRLDDLDAPPRLGASVSDGAARPLDAFGWQDAVVRTMEWTGTLPVRVVARADNALLPEVVRFAHRLECPVSLRTCARGLTPARAEELVDAGLSEVAVRVAGATDAVQQAVLGESVADGVEAFRSLLMARRSRGASLVVQAELVVCAPSAPQLREVFGAARATGLDGVYLAAPWASGAVDASVRDSVRWAQSQHAPFHRTSREVLDHLLRDGSAAAPGVARRGGRCAVAGLRVELDAQGRLSFCPFKAGAVPARGDAPSDGLRDQRTAVRTCDRSCAHPDLCR